MKKENGIPILENTSDTIKKEELFQIIAVNALKTMTETLVRMENSGTKEKDMIRKCVWPILYEAERRYEAIEKGLEVETGNFIFYVKSQKLLAKGLESGIIRYRVVAGKEEGLTLVQLQEVTSTGLKQKDTVNYLFFEMGT